MGFVKKSVTEQNLKLILHCRIECQGNERPTGCEFIKVPQLEQKHHVVMVIIIKFT